MALALDASTLLSWYFNDEASPTAAFVDRLAREEVIVPNHFEAEVANGVLIGERRGRSTPSQAANLVAFIENVSPEVDAGPSGGIFGLILPLARAYKLTVYDAIYLELAERRGLALATLDKDLTRAAKAAGLDVISR